MYRSTFAISTLRPSAWLMMVWYWAQTGGADIPEFLSLLTRSIRHTWHISITHRHNNITRHYRGEGVGVQRQERHDGLQQAGDAVPVCPHQTGAGARLAVADARRREVGVGEHELVAVSHAGQRVQQLGGQHVGHTLQHHHSEMFIVNITLHVFTNNIYLVHF